MAYPRTHKAVRRAKEVLDQILKLDPTIPQIEFPTADPVRSAYLIRGALHVVEEVYPKSYPQYLGLRSKWEIKLTSNSLIFRVKPEYLIQSPIIELRGSPDRLDLMECVNFLHVLGAIITHADQKHLGFPNAKLTNEELAQIEAVAGSKGWVIKNDGFISAIRGGTSSTPPSEIESEQRGLGRESLREGGESFVDS